ncbi:hypothetical protein C8R44DRAFT_749555 [Mycena epipterygia]|nr:hypothetical protein C8R44DRAFT_749555 [Mycena epipterygia]
MLAAHLRTRLAEIDSLISQTKLRLQELEDMRRPIQRQLDDLRCMNDGATDFLRLLRLPSLQNLHLSDMEYIDNKDFLPFLTHSSASLRTFSTDMETAALSKQWFTVMSGLTHVELYAPGSNFAFAFLSSLDRAQHKEFLPRLESLAFVNSSFFDVRALSSRCDTAPDGAARLQSFRVIWPNGWSRSPQDSAVETLRGLVERGMKIHIGTQREITFNSTYSFSS